MRPEIAKSWLRSRLSGVPLDQDLQVAFVPGFDPEGRLLRAATPVLDRLAVAVAGTRATVVLGDNQARILERRAGERSLNAHLDVVGLAPGFSYAEELVGTNGIGTAVVERRPVQVAGSEHFLPRLRSITCVGAPIHHPITGRLEGVLDITCRSDDATDRTLPLVLASVREIEERLYEQASVSERALLENFLILTRHSKQPVVSMNEDFAISNVAASRLLEPADHSLLWELAAEALGRHEEVGDVRLASGLTVRARCWEILHDGIRAGAAIRLDVPKARRQAATKRSATVVSRPRPISWSDAWQDVWAAMTEHADDTLPLLILGEPGVGKIWLAGALHEESSRGGRLSVFDAALAAVGSAQFFASLRSRLTETTGTLVVSHLETLDRHKTRVLCSLIDKHAGTAGPRLVGTMVPGAAPRDSNHVQPLLDRFGTRITIPPLRERPEDIIALVTGMISERTPPVRPRRLTPEAGQVLARLAWPGNIRQLENVIRNLVLRRLEGDITLEDLPPDIRGAAPARRLTGMERAERNAILAALVECAGNKVQAAAKLGLGRATLYRKLRTLGVDSTRFDS
jgi:transcriptional regulator of acetoin/glycerol metabolism